MACDSILDVLIQYDVLGAEGGLPFSPHRNVLVDIPARMVHDEYTAMKCRLWQPEGKGHERFLQQALIVPGDRCLETTQVVLWDICQAMPPLNTKVWLLNLQDPILVPGCNDLVLRFQEDSQWFPVTGSGTIDPMEDTLHVLELFSGGFGGWKTACDFIQGHSATKFQVVGIDHDFDACAQYAATFHANMLSLHRPVDPLMLVKSTENWVLHGSIDDCAWIPLIGHWGPHVVTISAPCPPWTAASHSQGVLRPEGMMLVRAILSCRWFRPEAILLEQVPGFGQHEQKPLVLQCLHHIGYRMVFQKVLNVSDSSFVQRPRWLGLALRIHGEARPFTFQPWIKSEVFAQMSDFCLPLTAEEKSQLQLSADALRAASNPDYVKNARPSMTVDQVFRSRVFQPGQYFPTFMATYGHQHDLPVEHLKKFGYFAHFLADPTSDLGCRFMSPFEILLLHGVTHSCFLVNDLSTAWRTVGNFICTQHALVLLANACNCVGPEILDVESLFRRFQMERLTASNVRCHSIVSGTFLLPDDSMKTDAFLTSVEQLFEARFTFGSELFQWHPTSGFHLPDLTAEVADTQLTDSQQIARINAYLSQVSAEELLELEDVSPTVLWAPVTKGVIHFQQDSLGFWYSADLTHEELTYSWGGAFTCDFHACDIAGHTATMRSSDAILADLEELTGPLVLYMEDGKLTLLPGEETTPLKSLPYFQDGHDLVWSPYAQIDCQEVPVSGRVYLNKELQYGLIETFPAVLMAGIKNTSGIWEWNPSTDVVSLQLQGDDFSVKTMLGFWSKILLPTSLRELGRQAVIDGGRISFPPLGDNVACPQFAFREVLAITAARCLLQNLIGEFRDFADELKEVHVKWTNFIWEYQLPSLITVEVLIALLEYGFSPFIGKEHFRPLVRGRMVAFDTALKDLPVREGRQEVRVDLVLSIRGGGPSKTQQKALHQNVIAGLFLEQGYDLEWTTKAVNALVEKCGIAKLQTVSTSPMGAMKIQALDKLCQEAGVVKPTIGAPTTRKQFAGAPWNNKKKKLGFEHIDIGDYRIDDGFFFCQDDTPAVQLQEMHAQKNGVVLSSYEGAKSWLTAGEVISSDELGLLLLGPKPLQCQMPSQAVVIPCHTSRGQPVLLSAQLFQFGSKAIKVKQSDPKDQIKSDQAQLMAITFHKTDWQMDEWQKILHETPKFLKTQLQVDQLEGSVQSSWGRSYRVNQTPASPVQAQTVQIHAMIVADKIDEVLKKSGFNRMYFTPKVPSGKLSDEYKVLWSSGDKTALEVLSAKVPNCYGLVRSRTNLGLRVRTADFDAAWAIVNPNTPVPTRDEGDLLYKVAGLPFGCSLAMMEAWLTNVGWKAKPVKAIGAQAWLVRACDRPPAGHLLFNSSPVLLTFLPPKPEVSRPILAGPAPRPKVQGGRNPGATPEWPQGDPWQNWQGSTGSASVSAPVARQTDGPTSVRLQAQDAKIEALQLQMSKMSDHQKAMDSGLTQRMTAMEKQTADHQVFVEKSLQSLRGDMDQALQQSLTKTAQLMDSKFEDLKSLFAGRANKRSPDDDAPMDTK